MEPDSSPGEPVPDNRLWKCAKCGEVIETQFDSCWKCSEPRQGNISEATTNDPEAPAWRLAHRIFRGDPYSWDELFSEATEFATDLGPDRVVNLSHSTDKQEALVVVWYWTDVAVTPAD